MSTVWSYGNKKRVSLVAKQDNCFRERWTIVKLSAQLIEYPSGFLPFQVYQPALPPKMIFIEEHKKEHRLCKNYLAKQLVYFTQLITAASLLKENEFDRWDKSTDREKFKVLLVKYWLYNISNLKG